ncbi:rod shape-determining protein MreD, partial [Patescibacteria group bacterium]|nr:rod shape-determining protein MreD [Patescibacteria group bacterium]
VILQATLVPFITLWGVSPKLILVLILILVILKKFEKVWWLILLSGLFLDFLVGLPFGLVSLSLVSTAYLIDRFNQSVFSRIKFWVLTILVILGSLVYNILLFGLGIVFQAEVVFSLRYLLIEIVCNLIITLIFYAGFKKIFR